MSTELKPASPVDKLIEAIATSMHQWQEEQVSTIGASVRKRLDEGRDEVLMKLMGFDNDSWKGKWQIDHGNGRQGESIAGKFFLDAQKSAIKEWLSAIPMPKMTPAFKAKIAKDLHREYMDALRGLVDTAAYNKANADMDVLLEETLKPTRVEMHLRVQSLINPPTKSPT